MLCIPDQCTGHWFAPAVQPQIEARMAKLDPDGPMPDNIGADLKPFRVLRKRLATFCLFLVIISIILGVQVYGAFTPVINLVLIVFAAVFAWRANTSLVRFGWI